MTKKQKGILFLSLLLLFVIIAPLVILYSQGYRFDLENKKIVKTGGLFLKIQPPGVTVYLNHILYKKTNLVFDSLFIGNLAPKKYHILVKKEGYQNWEKELPVSEMMVTEAKNIHLFKKEYNSKLLSQNIKKIFVSPDKNFLLLEKTDNDSGWSLWLFDLSSGEEKKLLSAQDLLLESSPKKEKILLKDLILSNDSRKAILIVENKKQSLHYFLLNINHNNQFIELPLQKYEISKIFFNPQNPEEILFMTKSEQKNLFLLDQNFKIYPIKTFISDIKVLDLEPFQDSIYLLASNGLAYKTFLSGSSLQLTSVLNLQPKNIDFSKHYQIFVLEPQNVFLLEDQTLYYLNPQKYKFQLVAKNIDRFVISPNYNLVAFSWQNKIFLYYLKDCLDQPKAFQWERIKLIELPENILNIDWFDNSYIIYSTPNGIYVTETDFRDNRNIYTITNFSPQQFFWEKNSKDLFFVSKNNLFKISLK